MTRKLHTGLTHLFAGLLVVQFFLAGLGVFTTVHDKRLEKDSNFDAHAALGSLLVLVALLIMLAALVGRWSRRVTQTGALLFGLMIVQMLLAGFGADDAPVLGGLHVGERTRDRRGDLCARARVARACARGRARVMS